jgi:hypothetical protein
MISRENLLKAKIRAIILRACVAFLRGVAAPREY